MDEQEYNEKLMQAATGGLAFRENHGEGRYGLAFLENEVDGEREEDTSDRESERNKTAGR